mmetsp:Transcript_36717/g.122941  ORF Transcript_36717/g.122941 Transcript_36717/m.122941 type:complete len:520 (+) Transcript_36717:425-1984(+)
MLEAVQRLCLVPRPTFRDALFFPHASALERLLALLRRAKFSIDVCVYCVTEERLVAALRDKAAAGVAVRIVSDNDQAFNKGAAIFKTAAFAYTVVDEPLHEGADGRKAEGEREKRMHHKFCVVDHRILATGSFNWTGAASSRNCENILVSSEPKLVSAYSAEFERLHATFSRSNPVSTAAAATKLQAALRGRAARLPPAMGRAQSSKGTAEEKVAAALSQMLAQAPSGRLSLGACRALLQRLNLRPVQARWLLHTATEECCELMRRRGRRRTAAAEMAALLSSLGSLAATLESELLMPRSAAAATLFFPSVAAREELCGVLATARHTLDVCVFTLSDRRIADTVLDAHKRGAAVRLITDDVTAMNDGSLVFELAEAGVATVVDSDFEEWRTTEDGSMRRSGSTPRHMHHKFCLVDGQILLTGSYNFSWSAGNVNCENMLITDDPYHVRRYGEAFEGLWREFRRAMYVSRQEAAVRIQRIERGRRERTAGARGMRQVVNAASVKANAGRRIAGGRSPRAR